MANLTVSANVDTIMQAANYEAIKTLLDVGATITVASDSADTTCFPLFVNSQTGDLAVKTNSLLTFNSATGAFAVDTLTVSSTAVINGLTISNSPSSELTISPGTVFETTGTSGIVLAAPSTGAPITYTLPSAAGTLATLAGTETLSNKTFGSNILFSANNTFDIGTYNDIAPQYVYAAKGFQAYAGSAVGFSVISRGNVNAIADGVWVLYNNAQNKGVGFSVSTDGALTLRNRTNAAAGELVAGSVTSSGFAQFTQIGADPTLAADSAGIYSKDVAGIAEMFVKDEAGNVTQISPHATDSPGAAIDAESSDALPIVLRHANEFIGTEEWVHVSAMAKELEALTGKQFVYSRPLPGNRKKQWNEVQATHVAKRDAERAEWATRRDAALAKQAEYDALPDEEMAKQSRPEFTETEPELYAAKQKPAFLNRSAKSKPPK